MTGRLLKTFALLPILWTVGAPTDQSPCPNYFQYVLNEDNEILGSVEIPSPPRGIALHISVAMSIAVALPSKYVGRLELALSKEDSVHAVQQGLPLVYRIYFPLQRPVPTLTGLWFNNRLICSGPRAVGPIVTSIVLNHTLYPPGVIPSLEGQGQTGPAIPVYQPPPPQPQTPPPINYHPVQPPQRHTPAPSRPTPRPTPRPRPPPPTQRPPQRPPFKPGTTVVDTRDPDDQCGQSDSSNSINPLIALGEDTAAGQWPWLVAIFVVKLKFEFQCAGTLVTNTHVVTAAHCVQLDNVNVPSGALLVSVGRYRLRDWRERGSVNREVADYRLHPDYNSLGSADADIAIMFLRERVEYSATIKPICLWNGPTNLQDVVGKYGWVVGWGQDENGNRNVQEPRMARIPIVSQEVCLWSNGKFAEITSNRTFCAGSRDGTGPCNGDSGSGFVILDPDTSRFQLRGVVSRSFRNRSSASCDLTQYVVYVDVAMHMRWIRRQIAA